MAADHFDRRRFLHGMAISVAVAACSNTRAPARQSTVPIARTTTSLLPSPDVGVLRLASSIEHYLVGLYETVAATGLVQTQSVADAARYFADHHADHAKADEASSVAAGGHPFTTANQAVAALFRPRLDAVKSEADVVKLLYDAESMAAATYVSTMGRFKDQRFNAGVAGIMAIEARHVAVLGLLLSGLPQPTAGIVLRTDAPPYAAAGFQTSAGAVAPGTGV